MKTNLNTGGSSFVALGEFEQTHGTPRVAMTSIDGLYYICRSAGMFIEFWRKPRRGVFASNWTRTKGDTQFFDTRGKAEARLMQILLTGEF